MYTDVPKLTRCCFCLPLRLGLLVWAYIKLIPLALFLGLLIIQLVDIIQYISQNGYRPIPPVFPILVVVLAVDLVFNIILIVAAHKKHLKLFRYYYYYAVTILVLLVTLLALYTASIIAYMYLSPIVIAFLFHYIMISVPMSISIIFVQCYIVLLVRTEMLKLRNNSNFQFVNNAAEAQCVMNMEKA